MHEAKCVLVIRSAQPATLIVCRVLFNFECTIQCTQCSVQYSVEYIIKNNIVLVLGTIYRRQGDGRSNGNKSSQLATWMSGYSLVYIRVYSTVHIVLYSEVFSTL